MHCVRIADQEFKSFSFTPTQETNLWRQKYENLHDAVENKNNYLKKYAYGNSSSSSTFPSAKKPPIPVEWPKNSILARKKAELERTVGSGYADVGFGRLEQNHATSKALHAISEHASVNASVNDSLTHGNHFGSSNGAEESAGSGFLPPNRITPNFGRSRILSAEQQQQEAGNEEIATGAQQNEVRLDEEVDANAVEDAANQEETGARYDQANDPNDSAEIPTAPKFYIEKPRQQEIFDRIAGAVAAAAGGSGGPAARASGAAKSLNSSALYGSGMPSPAKDGNSFRWDENVPTLAEEIEEAEMAYASAAGQEQHSGIQHSAVHSAMPSNIAEVWGMDSSRQHDSRLSPEDVFDAEKEFGKRVLGLEVLEP